MDQPILYKELPFRSKLIMAEDIAKLIAYLHSGEQSKADPLTEDLKMRALFLDQTIQQDVLIFINQIQFQYDYDPWHLVTTDVQKAADQLLEDMGFQI